MRELLGEDFSPWTEKACWALNHHGIPYSFRQYQPMLDEPALRLRTRNFRSKATVPVLFDDAGVFPDSFSIARHAENLGSGTAALFPEGRAEDVGAWNDCSEAALRAGRALFLVRLAGDRAAQLDNLPPFVPRALRPALRPIVRSGIGYLRWKHGIDDDAVTRARTQLETSLNTLREALSHGSNYILGSFSYADVAMAVVCQFIAPVDDRYIALTPANRSCWTEETLARSFEDILRWRDDLYMRHHRAVSSRTAVP
ncbi:glutathione S-transferase N-terminal domain-containing protein [Pendulispora rubella]|uniref:Glutathione S-transferase N-terminal domain-containing protein n=1 Tax=Pendulispora rubella TaxID=2741070 RepID=A0ABZ2L7H9_9BACT